jgi:hypothetical protein
MTKGSQLQARRREQAKAALARELADSLVTVLRSDPDIAQRLKACEAKVASGKMAPTAAAAAIAASLRSTIRG